MISTIVEGLLGGLVHSILIRRGRTDKVFNPITAGAVTFVAEMVQMLIIWQSPDLMKMRCVW